MPGYLDLNTSENNFETNHKSEEYLKENCLFVSSIYFFFRYFLEFGFVKENIRAALRTLNMKLSGQRHKDT